MNVDKLAFGSDYMEGAHPEVMQRLMETNMLHTDGYGTDQYTEAARNKIRKACNCDDALVYFLCGGTQTNSTVISALLKPYQGVMAADTGHINIHESGAVEATGHKVIALPSENGKIKAQTIKDHLENYYSDPDFEHVVMPGMVYISHPTELGTLYSLEELEAISAVCRNYKIPLYLDGARLAAALACPVNDITLEDLARLCDAFYIGGTKCGALLGEAVVIPDQKLIPHFFMIIKQRGALFAKGRIPALMFDALFTNDLYLRNGRNSIETADRLRAGITAKGIPYYLETPTNQIFVIVDNEKLKEIDKNASYCYWGKVDEDHTAIRFVTSWATTMEDVEKLLAIL